MILGIDDIIGGRAIVNFFIWLGLTGLFYLVGYVAALNLVDDFTKNSWTKIPAMWSLAFVTSGFMSILNYNPIILFFIMLVANYFRLKNLISLGKEKSRNLKRNNAVFYLGSYGYIFLVLAVTHYIDFHNNL